MKKIIILKLKQKIKINKEFHFKPKNSTTRQKFNLFIHDLPNPTIPTPKSFNFFRIDIDSYEFNYTLRRRNSRSNTTVRRMLLRASHGDFAVVSGWWQARRAAATVGEWSGFVQLSPRLTVNLVDSLSRNCYFKLFLPLIIWHWDILCWSDMH